MKIDFDAGFRHVSRLVDSSKHTSQAKQASPRFDRLLAGVSPANIEAIENNDKIMGQRDPSSRIRSDLKGPMASFNFPTPRALNHSLTPLTPEVFPDEVVNEESGGVKTPTVLEVRRVMEEASQNVEQVIVSPELAPTGAQAVPMTRTERAEFVKELVQKYGAENGIDPLLGMAVAAAESSFDPNAVSQDGHASKGLFQLLDSTGLNFMERTGTQGKYDPFNPNQNTQLGVSYMRYLHDIFSQRTDLPNNLSTEVAANSSSLEKLAVAAYNAGEGRVASAQHRAKVAGFNPSNYEQVRDYLPDSTQEYVRRVMTFKQEFESDFIG